MFRSFACRGNERKIDIGGRCRRQLFLCLLRRFFQSLERHLISRQIHALLLLELRQHIICNLLVKIIAAKPVVAGRRKYLDYAVANLNDGYVEGTASKVVYHDLLLFLIVKTISQGSGRRLVDNTLYIKTRDLTRVLGSLTLRVIKISRNGNNRLRYLFAKISFRVRLHLL